MKAYFKILTFVLSIIFSINAAAQINSRSDEQQEKINIFWNSWNIYYNLLNTSLPYTHGEVSIIEVLDSQISLQDVRNTLLWSFNPVTDGYLIGEILKSPQKNDDILVEYLLNRTPDYYMKNRLVLALYFLGSSKFSYYFEQNLKSADNSAKVDLMNIITPAAQKLPQNLLHQLISDSEDPDVIYNALFLLAMQSSQAKLQLLNEIEDTDNINFKKALLFSSKLGIAEGIKKVKSLLEKNLIDTDSVLASIIEGGNLNDLNWVKHYCLNHVCSDTVKTSIGKMVIKNIFPDKISKIFTPQRIWLDSISKDSELEIGSRNIGQAWLSEHTTNINEYITDYNYINKIKSDILTPEKQEQNFYVKDIYKDNRSLREKYLWVPYYKKFINFFTDLSMYFDSHDITLYPKINKQRPARELYKELKASLSDTDKRAASLALSYEIFNKIGQQLGFYEIPAPPFNAEVFSFAASKAVDGNFNTCWYPINNDDKIILKLPANRLISEIYILPGTIESQEFLIKKNQPKRIKIEMGEQNNNSFKTLSEYTVALAKQNYFQKFNINKAGSIIRISIVDLYHGIEKQLPPCINEIRIKTTD